MFNVRRLALFLGALLPSVLAAPAPATPEPEAIPGKFIVTLKATDASHVQSHLAWVGSIHTESLSKRNTAGVEKTYNIADWHAYAGEFDEETIARIRASPDVDHVSPDYIMHLADVVRDKRALTIQYNSTWGLGTISHRRSGSLSYIYDTSAGAGTYAYVIDSGILTTHEDFSGRASLGYNAVRGTNHVDTLGHGTHVAATIAGSTYGVAKAAYVISVKVFSGGSSPTSVILDGYNWAVRDILANERAARAAVSMSLGGPANPVWTTAIEAAHGQGVLTVVAAGNGDPQTGLPLPVSSQSPANVQLALTVGAVDKDWVIAPWSNYGPGVDILAPGVGVLSAYIGSNTATAVLDGTSMATPHVTGLALYLKALEGLALPAVVYTRIKALATAGFVLGPLRGSPNQLAYNGNGA